MLLTRMSSHGRILFVEMILSAALAQLVERRLGKAEVGGSNPLGSSSKNRNTFQYSGFFFFQSGLISTFICTNLFYQFICSHESIFRKPFLLRK